MSPTANQTTLDSSSVSPQEQEALEAAANQTNSFENLGNVPPVNDYVSCLKWTTIKLNGSWLILTS